MGSQPPGAANEPTAVTCGKYRWKPLPWGDCPTCGDDVEVWTDIVTPADFANDGDDVRCRGCQWRGAVSCDEEDEAWLQEGNAEDLCDAHHSAHCRMHECIAAEVVTS
jgi:hypothetical protein